MSLNDPLSNAFSVIGNMERAGGKSITLKPISKLMKTVLKILKDGNYIGDFKEVEDGRGGYIKVNLLGSINKCGAIKPRYPVKTSEFEKFEKRFLPAKDFGILVVSTSKGIMTHYEAKEKRLGGKLIGYCY